MRTAIYMRKSTEDKDEKQVHSIERQQIAIKSFVERYNETVEPSSRLVFGPDDIYKEDRSAKIPGRPEFGRLIRAIENHKYEVLLCFDLTRLSRNPIDAGTLTHILDKGELLEIRTVDGKAFRNIPTDKFTFSLFLAVAKYENDQR